MDCLILCDEIDCNQYKEELATEALSDGLKPRFLLRQHLGRLIEESRHLPPFLLYSDTTHRIGKAKELLAFHRQNQSFGIIRTSDGTILSINPTKVNIGAYGPDTENDSTIFTTTNVTSSRKLLPIDPPHLILIGHSRSTYFQLTLNSLLFSLGDRASLVPLTIVLVTPTPEVVAIAKKTKELHPHIQIIATSTNTHTATPTFVIKFLELRGQHPETIVVMEDDFILPTTAKIRYPDWPWWFAWRLQQTDLVAWLPSLDNCPIAVQKYINRYKINITRNTIEGSRWLSTSNNYAIAMGGTAVAVKTSTYKVCAKRSNTGYPVDTELSALGASISAPSVFGYHIGWNQEQDGYGSLSARNWPKVARSTTITDLENGSACEISL